MSGRDVMAFAGTLVGTPWRHQGRSARGLDCLGLVMVTLDHFNLVPKSVPRPLDYELMPAQLSLMAKTVTDNYPRVTKPGSCNIILMKWPTQAFPNHIGLLGVGYGGRIELIHSYRLAAKVVRGRYGAPWTRMTSGLFSIPGVDE